MALSPGVHEVTCDEVDAAASEGAAIGARVFALTTRHASTRSEVFDAVREALPLDPPLVGSKSWDALSDSLWSGIDGVDASVVVITWKGAADLRRSAPEEFSIAIAVLRDVASSLANWADTNGEPKQVCVYVS